MSETIENKVIDIQSTDNKPVENTLKKNLTLFDVYSISTGAMFSSGLFLLPGIAASYTGNSVWLAYFVAGFLILPAMYSIAELSTAMPKAGGAYYFLDRAMGPLMGTIGGLGSWVAVVFKSSFALVGMGAYLGIYLDVPITFTAIILTIAFGLLNIFGAKETTFVQRILVTTLVAILTGFVILGMQEIELMTFVKESSSAEDFFKSGLVGFVSTIGLVFVSYAGLTKVASVAEEIENPDRNIPLGMTLSLLTATVIYTLGTLVLVAVLEPTDLHNSLTPVADAAREFLNWVPYDLGVIFIVIAAIAAFASTGNAGIMSASRYPFAMAKDKLVPEGLNKIGRFGTPSIAIFFTVIAMIGVLLLFDVTSVAKLASAFQLLLFGLICVAVIVMRESKIPTYKPGYTSPFYPWLQIAGILVSFWLIIEMGILAIGFTGMLLIGCVLWYQFYASDNIERKGAILHVHERLGQQRYDGLEQELLTIIKDRTIAENLSYEAVVGRSVMMDFRYGIYDLNHIGEILKEQGTNHYHFEPELINDLLQEKYFDLHAITEDIQITYVTHEQIERPELFVMRFGPRAKVDIESAKSAHTLMFLVVPPKPVGLDLRLAGHLTEVMQAENFEAEWLATESEIQMKEALMRHDHFLQGPVNRYPILKKQIGLELQDFSLPESCVITLIVRNNSTIQASPEFKLVLSDEVVIIGEPEDLEALQNGKFEQLDQLSKESS